ncbi:hypothetical protein RIF23_18150 [Lipingzhangella sp. LS1_29]|uniref:Uncharacterized protein n=1 Tax=Lipingzhangella rawalii TaxID=2055835 RepID=A0ABU2HA72_9ACTN|nr:hypothetical protein [Lipingzhangella rawalii]MDS1272215.1 hypothetical protein [Lipingzhangella rawalii]
MTVPKHARPAHTPARAGSTERRHLTELAAALAPYGVWSRVLADGTVLLRVSNPASQYAVEDIACARQPYQTEFHTTFGVRIGDTDDVPAAAHNVAWLVGMVEDSGPGAGGPRPRPGA